MSTQSLPNLPQDSAFLATSNAIPLPPKRACFAQHFVFGPDAGNGTKCAIAAGFSEKSAAQTASLLLRNEKVKAEIARLTAKKYAKLEITGEKVLNEIARLAFLDPRKFFKTDGSLIPVTELPEDVAASLAGLEVETENRRGEAGEPLVQTRVTKIKIADKGVNLERLGKHLKLFTERVEFDIGSNLAGFLTQARQRTGMVLDAEVLEGQEVKE